MAIITTMPAEQYVVHTIGFLLFQSNSTGPAIIFKMEIEDNFPVVSVGIVCQPRSQVDIRPLLPKMHGPKTRRAMS